MGTSKILPASIKGIRYREHPSRKHGKQKDKYFFIRYTINQKTKEEGVGWSSEGWSEKRAAALLYDIKENIRLGRHPQTLAEMREMNKKEQQEEEETKSQNTAETVTLQDVFKMYKTVQQPILAKKSWATIECQYCSRIAPILATKKLCEITIDDMQTIVTQTAEKQAARTAEYVKAVFRQIFNFAIKRNLYLKNNPAIGIQLKRKDNKRTRFFTTEEANMLLKELSIRSPDWHDMALLSLYAGLRAGEIFKLTWEHVSWSTDRLFIADPKNGDGRFEPMHDLVKAMLQRRYKTDNTGYIFKSRNGGQIKEVSDTFDRAIEKLGFNKGITDSRQKLVFHSLRHTYASWLVMNGVDLYTTQKLMGHKSSQMTQRYAHLAPGHLDKAVQGLPPLNTHS